MHTRPFKLPNLFTSTVQKVFNARLRMFRTNQPAEREIEAFHRDGYIAYKDVMEDDYYGTA